MAYSPVPQFISPTYKFIALFSAGIRAGQPVVPHDAGLAQLAQLGARIVAQNLWNGTSYDHSHDGSGDTRHSGAARAARCRRPANHPRAVAACAQALLKEE
jgi:hypothetical protein